MDKGVKNDNDACNTVSASAKKTLYKVGTIPVIDVISAGAQAASKLD